MAGQTRGTYRNSIPAPPVIDRAYLHDYFADRVSPRRWPHANNPSGKSRGELRADLKRKGLR